MSVKKLVGELSSEDRTSGDETPEERHFLKLVEPPNAEPSKHEERYEKEHDASIGRYIDKLEDDDRVRNIFNLVDDVDARRYLHEMLTQEIRKSDEGYQRMYKVSEIIDDVGYATAAVGLASDAGGMLAGLMTAPTKVASVAADLLRHTVGSIYYGLSTGNLKEALTLFGTGIPTSVVPILEADNLRSRDEEGHKKYAYAAHEAMLDDAVSNFVARAEQYKSELSRRRDMEDKKAA